MDKVVSFSPLPAIIISELFKMHGVTGIDVVDASAFSPDQDIEAVRDADYIISDYTFKHHITRDIAKAAQRVKLIQQPSVGYQHIDIDACTEFGIKVANTAGANSIAVAEHVVMTALCLIKNIMFACRTTAAGKWQQMDVHSVELSGKTWGFIGFGRVGKAVAERLIPFGPKMIYFDPHRMDAQDEIRYRTAFAELTEVLKSSDVLSLQCPLTDETSGLMDRKNIALLKPGAMVINIARGEVIDEAALAEALKAGKLGGAALDVFAAEPIDHSNPLLELAGDKVILTPHIAGVSEEAKGRIINMTIANIVKVMKGQIPESLVN